MTHRLLDNGRSYDSNSLDEDEILPQNEMASVVFNGIVQFLWLASARVIWDLLLMFLPLPGLNRGRRVFRGVAASAQS